MQFWGYCGRTFLASAVVRYLVVSSHFLIYQQRQTLFVVRHFIRQLLQRFASGGCQV
jgi:hypothetical protein